MPPNSVKEPLKGGPLVDVGTVVAIPAMFCAVCALNQQKTKGII